MIVPIGSDPHMYRAKPSDARMVQQADVILVNRLSFEGWITKLIENSGSKAEVVTITKGIDVIKAIGYDNSPDPHAWMSAKNGVIYIKNIKDALVAKYPKFRKPLERNYEKYKEQLIALDAEIEAAIQKIPAQQRVLITTHDAFQYYGKRYQLDLEAIQGISTEAKAQTSDIIRVTKAIRERKVPAVFVESTINPKMLEQIAADSKVKVGGELYADSLGDEDEAGGTYIGMLRHNTNAISKALSQVISEDKEELKTTNKPAEGFLADQPLGLRIALALGVLLAMFMVIYFKWKQGNANK